MNISTGKAILWGTVTMALVAALAAVAMPQTATAVADDDFDFTSVEFNAARQEAKLTRSLGQTTGQTDPSQAVICGLGITCGFLKALNWLLDRIASLPLAFAQGFFVEMITQNFDAFGPRGGQYMIATTLGWNIVLGVVNMFFVLWLLWIAIGTIFDFEPFTARTLLFKIILAALLINFSLPIGRAFIRLANGLAEPFWNVIISPEGLGGIDNAITIIANPEPTLLTVQNSYFSIDRDGAKNILDKARAEVEVGGHLGFIGGGKVSYSVDECYNQVNSLVTLSTRSSDDIRKVQRECQKLLSNEQVIKAYATINPSAVGENILAVAVVAKAITIPLAVFALFAGGIFLLIRLVSLMLLLIGAPLAFFSLAVPGLSGQAGAWGWNTWWSSLFKWSFYLPAFLFLFMLSIMILQGVAPESLRLGGGGEGLPNATALFIQYLVGIVLMFVSVTIANFMGIYGAGAVMAGGKAVGGWTARFAGRRALTMAAPAAKAFDEGRITGFQRFGIPRIERVLTRGLTAIPGVRRGLQGITSAKRQEVERRQKQLDRFSSDDLKRRYGLTSTWTDRAAIANVLASRRDFSPTAAEQKSGLWTTQKVQQSVTYLRSIGENVSPLLRAVPHLAGSPAEIEKVIQGMRAEHIERMDPEALDDENVLRAIAKYWRAGQYSKMMSFSPNVMVPKFVAAITGNAKLPGMDGEAAKRFASELVDEIKKDKGTREYFKSSPTHGFGYPDITGEAEAGGRAAA